MTTQVFLSVGRVPTTTHKQFIDKVEAKLLHRGLVSKTIGRNTFTAGQPLDKIKEEMRASRGLLVFAMKRTSFPDGGSEFRRLDQPPEHLRARSYATPWHQIEISMATTLGLPTLVLLETGVHEEGLLEEIGRAHV